MALETEYSAKLLIVDDDAAIRRVLKQCFLDEGYDVWTAADGMQMRTILEKNLFDIILLDLSFPGKDDGIDLMREVRSKSNVPVIIISARSDLTDKIVALEVGADDFITKLFELREIHSRVRAILRRARTEQEETGHHVYQFDELQLDPETRTLFKNTREVPLTTGEFKMLMTLITHPGRVLSRDFLMLETRSRHFEGMDRSIDAQIMRLRRKIEIDVNRPRIVKSIHGVGYSLGVPVSKVKKEG